MNASCGAAGRLGRAVVSVFGARRSEDSCQTRWRSSTRGKRVFAAAYGQRCLDTSCSMEETCRVVLVAHHTHTHTSAAVLDNKRLCLRGSLACVMFRRVVGAYTCSVVLCVVSQAQLECLKHRELYSNRKTVITCHLVFNRFDPAIRGCGSHTALATNDSIIQTFCN